MYDPDNQPGELDKLVRAGLSGIGSGVRGVAVFLAAGVAYGALIGKIEQIFYEIPYVALSLWLLTGFFIFRACERGNI